MNIYISSLYVGCIKRTHLTLYPCSFRNFGDDWTIQNSVFKDIETFTCAKYRYLRGSSVNIVRSKILKKMIGEDKRLSANSIVDLTRLPPCKTSLVQRVNYRLCCYKKAHIQMTKALRQRTRMGTRKKHSLTASNQKHYPPAVSCGLVGQL